MPSCVGKLPLGVAIAQLTSLACDIDPDKLLRAVASKDAVLQATFRWLLEHFQTGQVMAWTRPLGGGLPQHLAVGYWQIDDPAKRFVISKISIATPFDNRATPDSWLFIDEEDFVSLWNLIVAAAEQRDEIRHSLPRMSHSNRSQAPTTFPATARGDARLLSLEQVIERVSLSKSAIYARIADGKFPGPIKVNSSSRWIQSELDEWMEAFRAR